MVIFNYHDTVIYASFGLCSRARPGPDLSSGSCLFVFSFLNPLVAFIMPAAVQCRAILASRQRFTFRETRLIVPTIFSRMSAQASDRRSSDGRPRRVTVRISSIPSKMLPATPGAVRAGASGCAAVSQPCQHHRVPMPGGNAAPET